MIDINKISSVYFLGIGGIGMSALARYFNEKGIKVSGYDKTETALTKKLQAENKLYLPMVASIFCIEGMLSIYAMLKM